MLSEINSKEIIKNRILKHALNYWDIKNTEDLDPAIKLILEALSSELYSLRNEIKDTHVRILEKISSLLTPDFLTLPNPAHGIMQAIPVEPAEVLTHRTSFFAQRKVSSKQNDVLDTTLDIFFTPVDTVKIFDVEIMYLITGGNLYYNDASFKKQLIARASKARTIENNILWIGLKMNPKIENIHNLFFCFDWKNMEPKLAHRIYQLLPLTKWYLGSTEIETKQGIQYEDSGNSKSANENIFLEHDLLSMLERDIKHYYDNKFVNISDTSAFKLNELKEQYPPEFRNYFSDADLQKMTEKLLWLKISFPMAIRQETLDEVYIYPNAFPVVNMQINDLKYRLKGGNNIIPLKTNSFQQFLCVESVSDETHQYKPIPYRKIDEEESGTYTLRNGGVERFDSRNARELIGYLLELLRSESAAFAAYGYDFVATTLKEMNQKIALMEQKTKGYVSNGGEVPNYIIVKPLEGHDMMYTEYWTTLGEGANSLRAGTRLQQLKGVKVKADSVSLMTTTRGGKGRLRAEERLNAFRYGIMTKNRVITKEDIRNFCFSELGERIGRVDVSRGFEISPQSKEAFRRTIDVILFPTDNEMLNMGEWEILCEQLRSKLETRSGMSNHYRIVVKKS